MGKRGPAPKPTALKVLQGNPGKRALPTNEIRPSSALPECPDTLDPVAKAYWAANVDMLARLRVFTEADGLLFSLLCQAYSEWKTADLMLQELGTPVFESDFGPKARPEVKIRKEAWMRLKQAAVEFGMSPSARARLALPEKTADRQGIAKYLTV